MYTILTNTNLKKIFGTNFLHILNSTFHKLRISTSFSTSARFMRKNSLTFDTIPLLNGLWKAPRPSLR